jgi:hypothetical protein
MKRKFLFIYCLLLFISQSIVSQKFELVFNGGYSYRVFTINDSVSDSYASYLKKKRPGFAFNSELIWYDDNQGFGLKFSEFMNNVDGNDLKLDSLNKIDKSESINIDFYSLQYHKKHQFGKSRVFGDFAVGLGYVRYSSEGKEYQEDVEIKGSTYGLSTTLSLNYQLMKRLMLGISTNIFLANLKEHTRNGYTEIEREGLTHVDFCGGLRFCF